MRVNHAPARTGLLGTLLDLLDQLTQNVISLASHGRLLLRDAQVVDVDLAEKASDRAERKTSRESSQATGNASEAAREATKTTGNTTEGTGNSTQGPASAAGKTSNGASDASQSAGDAAEAAAAEEGPQQRANDGKAEEDVKLAALETVLDLGLVTLVLSRQLAQELLENSLGLLCHVHLLGGQTLDVDLAQEASGKATNLKTTTAAASEAEAAQDAANEGQASEDLELAAAEVLGLLGLNFLELLADVGDDGLDLAHGVQLFLSHVLPVSGSAARCDELVDEGPEAEVGGQRVVRGACDIGDF